MKAQLLFLASLLPAVLFCQITNHFEQTDSRWNVAKSSAAGSMEDPSFVATRTTVYGFQGDSLFENDQWLKIYSTDDALFENNMTYRGLIRSEGDLVLYLDTLNQLDTLYNFGLTEGDSVLFNLYGENAEWLEIIEEGSIELNGEVYKTLKFEEPVMIAFDRLDEMWIEGIGSIHGPLFPNYPVKFSQVIPDSMMLTCTYSNQLTVWDNPFYSDCYINIVQGLDDLRLLNLKIYPNPFTDRIRIENKDFNPLNISISNGLGQEVKSFKIKGSDTSLDLSSLRNGFYFMTIESDATRVTVKILKND